MKPVFPDIPESIPHGDMPGDKVVIGAACNRFSTFLTEKNIPHSYVQGKGEHDLLYWDEHLEEAFRFLAGGAG